MIEFTMVKNEIVLSPNIILFKELKLLYDLPRGQKFLQIIFYRHSRDASNPFKDLSSLVLEENIIQVVFNKKTWEEVRLTKKEVDLFNDAERLYIKYNTTSEARLEKSLNKKLDEISDMLDETLPVIEKSYPKSGGVKFETNLTIILNMFTKIETVLRGKTTLQNAILKQEAVGKVRGGGTTSFREMGLLK